MNHRTTHAPNLIAVLQLLPACVLAASYRSESNPIGEHEYAAHLLRDLLPIGIVACGLLLAWIFIRVRAKRRVTRPQ